MMFISLRNIFSEDCKKAFSLYGDLLFTDTFTYMFSFNP